ncbi:conserved unknown protein [Ectocarpus siliculosus]|uniref:LNR domain-containing protein n=1 Tax=Ectocarpus siliculosus TaxID=2880 RepID=D8LEX5_ECTSI|nr:conserved unknown protein [Ectocarpus siliculosus]|eukprot:CBN79795.1 conserved unknown protein [Ectocarpus siliculosus]
MFEGCFNFGDGFCDDYNNNEQCGYDGGDCCECTCVVSTLWSTESSCTEFACIDPRAPCADDDDITADAVESCIIDYLGDGICDTSNNIETCGYDSGDCCECTCGYDSTDVLDGSCSDFACVDPMASCFDESITVDMFENCDAELLGDGYCQESNNNEICDYDFGDCCESTCGVDFSESLDEFACSSFACIDPRFVTQSPTPAPLSSECPGGPSCEEGMLESATNQGLIVAGIVTALNLFYLTCCRKDAGADEVHCYLLLMAYVFAVAEGMCVSLVVPNSKENLKIGAVFLFGAVSALSAFLLRKAGRHVTAAIVNAGLEGLFATVVLLYFVQLSTRNIFLFGAIAGNEALVGFAIAARVDSRPNSDESSFETYFEFGLLVGEAVGDVIFPLVATLIQSLFHRDSAWRSDFVFTWWSITGFALTSAICMCLVPPVSRVAFGAKLACLTQFFFSSSTGVMAFVILTLTEVNIADPPTFDIV